VEVVRIGGEGGAGWSEDDRPEVSDPELSDVEPEMPAEHPLVLVTWRDAWFDFDGGDSDGGRADYLVRTVGFLVRRDTRFLSVAQEILPDGDGFRAVTHIPVAVLASVTLLSSTGAAAELGLG
jgi:hypothetical protein